MEAGAGPARRQPPRRGGMTPARWRWIEELFAASIRKYPAGLASWLRQACGGDEAPQAQVDHPLVEDERAKRQGGPRSQEPPGRRFKATAARPAPAPAR